jgi:methionyl-tRNA formyltransferase
VTLRLAFMGTPDFAVPVLAALLDAGHDIVRVYTQPPRPAGRGQQERPSPVAIFAAGCGLDVATPKSLRRPEAQGEFAALALDAAVVAAYGLILPKPILDAPRLGCFNVHASLLPRWRGAAPIQRAILAGDAESGVTIMQMDEGLDTGAMLMAERVAITPGTNAGALHDALAAVGARLMVRALGDLEAGRARAVPQPADGVTYAAKIEKSETRIDWSRPAAELERVVRAFAPAPGAWFDHAGRQPERIRVLAAQVEAAQVEAGRGAPGTVLDDRLLVACGAGALRLLAVQRAGKAAMPAADFLRGNAIPAGTVLGVVP